MSQLEAASSLLSPSSAEGQLPCIWKSANGKSFDEIIVRIYDRIDNVKELGEINHERLNEYDDFQNTAGIRLERQEKKLKR